ncbi:hypothetical protein K458DRAFT_438165 [Lentithecium fluviatile CBS 122367]|uniref:C2H2-type domain-containing protein n=1 Tax=Lentithecium fluviatile CBS 122367 TaxID=1168545 RepID=A0A6G1JNK2_9PLEO|nr:hypothetical protein K458DRAFT_438165 [Lentithecium fluviatile CBS 122367]
MSLNYDSDDAFPRSPGLAPVRPRATPSPTPPPIVTHHAPISSAEKNVSPPSSRRRQRSNRRKARPSQGDFVLIRVMDPNRPDIAREVGERALVSESGSEVEDEDMDDRSQTAEAAPSEAVQTHSKPTHAPPGDLSRVAQDALNATTTTNLEVQPAPVKPLPPLFLHRDSVVELDSNDRSVLPTDTSTSHSSSTGPTANGVQPSTNGVDPKSPSTQASSPVPSIERHRSISNGYPQTDSLATSPRLRELTIPARRGSPSQKLPALQTPQSPRQEGSAGSPSQKQQLPSFSHLNDLAQTAIQEHERNFPHRQSISSTGQSPTSIGRQLSITSLSPGSAFPPLSASSSGGSSDMFLRSGQHLTLFSPARRPSQASDTGPYSATLHSATTNDSYQDGLSPGSQPTPIDTRGPRMSIGEALESRTLPLPVGSNIQHIPSHGSGGFKCDYPNCNAAPFQTQYLLNSHANVHSQTRPHFCPVRGCPRAEGGKGFKRKNEMIRHGLVHASPGYVCPFCPDREHKYPRPDNLQRHVRVHHEDKDKDDPQLREVLAQRPEGGSRGRRRRVS